MSVSYLEGHPWTSWSREERLFCAALYHHAAADANAFAEWLHDKAGISTALRTSGWDLGFEVCFYRDYLWHHRESARQKGFPTKRTFDLALFNDDALVIIEAKVCERFETEQIEHFAQDRKLLKSLLRHPGLNVSLVALASSRYFANEAQYGRASVLGAFDGSVTWRQVAAQYPDPVFEQADDLYDATPGSFRS